jgi:phosphoglycolate phosphatase-like HAD superfamily hydrolase
MTTLIFDLDGTLLDCRARHYTVYSETLTEMGCDPLSEANYWQRRRSGKGTLDVISRLPDDAVRSFRLNWFNRIERRDYLAMDRPFGGVAPALMDLARNNHLVLVTLRRDPEALASQLEKTRLAPYFHEVISPRGDIPARKSELLAEWYPIGETWVIGDSEADIDLASDIGARVICVTSGVRSQDYLHSRGGVLTLESVAELPEFLRHPMPRLEPSRFSVPVPDTAPVAPGRF